MCQVFNAKTKKWSKVAAMNCKRSAVGAVALGDHLYVCGGFDGISRFEPLASKLMTFNSIRVADIYTRRRIQYLCKKNGIRGSECAAFCRKISDLCPKVQFQYL
jgi:hypothetical protein